MQEAPNNRQQCKTIIFRHASNFCESSTKSLPTPHGKKKTILHPFKYIWTFRITYLSSILILLYFNLFLIHPFNTELTKISDTCSIRVLCDSHDTARLCPAPSPHLCAVTASPCGGRCSEAHALPRRSLVCSPCPLGLGPPGSEKRSRDFPRPLTKDEP